MEHIAKLFEKPDSFFTDSFDKYGTLQEETIEGISKFFWENDCICIYINQGRGYLRADQTLYPIQKGCLCMLHSYHVFRFESELNEPLKLQIMIFPYPEMVCCCTQKAFSKKKRNGELIKVINDAPTTVPLSDSEINTVEELISIYQEECKNTDKYSAILRMNILTQFQNLYEKAKPAKKLYPTPLCGEIFHYIGIYSLQPIQAADVAEHFHISTATVNSELNKICQCSFHEVLSHAQISNAYSGIFRRNISNETLARNSGFKNVNTFYREFNKLRKASPQQYYNNMIEQRLLSPSNEKLLEIYAYIYNHFQSPVNCELCAKELFLTSDVVNRLLKEHFGPQVTFSKYLLKLRLCYAEGLLNISNMHIVDIAIESGFNSVHTFIRQFKQVYKMTPSEYRKRQNIDIEK